jgi:hypothetical protein
MMHFKFQTRDGSNCYVGGSVVWCRAQLFGVGRSYMVSVAVTYRLKFHDQQKGGGIPTYFG